MKLYTVQRMTSTPQQWIIRALLNLRHRLLNGELQATGELTRSMAWRYDEENSDDDFYISETKALEKELKNLRKARTKIEKQAMDWRAVANDTFMLARYAKEEYDNGDIEDKRAVIMKLGQNLTVLDGQIQFDSVKYLIPIAEAYPGIKTQLDLVRNSSKQSKKDSEESLITQWCG